MNYPFSLTDVEEAAASLWQISDADVRRTLARILCGARFPTLEGEEEPIIDWNEQPPWAMYAAMDENGAWFVYNAEVEPDRDDGAWTAEATDDLEFERMTCPPDGWIGDWCCSRRVRPGTKEYAREMA